MVSKELGIGGDGKLDDIMIRNDTLQLQLDSFLTSHDMAILSGT